MRHIHYGVALTMRKLIGPHLAGQWAQKLDLLRQWQPPLVLLLSPDADKVQQLRAACPNTIVIGRFYHDDSFYAHNIATRPLDFARDIHQEIIENPATKWLDYVQTNNETNQDWAGIQQLDKFTLEWMHLADLSPIAYKCAILAFSVGNPDLPDKPGDPAGFDGRMLYWQQVLPSLNYAQRKHHLLLLHAYGYPDMFHPDADWYIYRYEQQVQANLRTLGITDLRYAYGEIGIDRLIVGDKGGYKVVTTDQDYTNQLLQWERDQQGQNLLLGGAVYSFGDSGGWDTYDITSTGVASMLATHYAEHAAEYANAEEAQPMETHLPFVGTGTQPAPVLPPIEWDERLTARGVTVEVPPLEPGQRYWRVKSVRWYDEQEADVLGPDHHIMLDALDIFGQRMLFLPIRITWPTDSTLVQIEQKKGESYGQGYGMSPSRNDYSVQVEDGTPSEIVRGIGMGMDTPNGFNAGIHTSTGIVFERALAPGRETDAPPPDTGTEQPRVEPPTPTMPTGIIEPRVAQAILQVESGGRAFGNDGEVLIRFEAHIFKSKLNNDEVWANYFRTDPEQPWTKQEWRRSPSDPWRAIHTDAQADEWAAYQFATLFAVPNADEAAAQSISMGAAQIMGFNHARVGYPTAQAMLHAFESESAQIIGFVNYFLSDPALMDAARRKDWREIARRYNGAGQVDYYAGLLQAAYEAVGA